jgi:hypothetical protein
MSKTNKRILSACIALFVLLGTFIFLYHRNSVKSQQIAVYEQNWKAANDSVEYYKLKNGELLAERSSYILSESQMREQLDMTKDEMADLKKKLNSSLASAAKVQTVVKIDSIYIESEPDLLTSDSISAPISFSDKWLSISGRVHYGGGLVTTNLYNISTSVPLTIGMSDDYKFFVSTSNPYVTVTDITSTINSKTIKKREHWGFGVHAGFGVQYGLNNKQFDWGPQVGVGINYNF